MAKAEQIEALNRRHAERDDTRVYPVAMELGSGRDHLRRGPSPREV